MHQNKKPIFKPTTDFQDWFNAECRSALNEVPQGIKDLARKDYRFTVEIAESIARKKCFSKDAVLSYLTSLI